MEADDDRPSSDGPPSDPFGHQPESGRADRSIPDPFPEPPVELAVEPAPSTSAEPWDRWLDEERAAQAHTSSIEAGRRRAGLAGAALAGSMLALRDIYEGPPKDEIAIEIEASSEPHDIDRDGISMTVDGIDVEASPVDPPPA